MIIPHFSEHLWNTQKGTSWTQALGRKKFGALKLKSQASRAHQHNVLTIISGVLILLRNIIRRLAGLWSSKGRQFSSRRTCISSLCMRQNKKPSNSALCNRTGLISSGLRRTRSRRVLGFLLDRHCFCQVCAIGYDLLVFSLSQCQGHYIAGYSGVHCKILEISSR